MLKRLSPIIAVILVFSCAGFSLHSYEPASYAAAGGSSSSVNLDDLQTKDLPAEKTTSTGKGSKTLDTYTDPAAYNDGTYTGSATGFNGKITVSVTVLNGKINAIKILSQSDDAAWFSKARKVIDRIISKQSTNVDTVSGATYSSVGIIKAVRNALKKAAKTVSSTDSDDATDITTPTESQETQVPVTPGDDGNASVVDGTKIIVNGNNYTATVWCNPDDKNEFSSYKTGIVSTIEVVDGVPQVTKVAVTDFKGASSDKAYINLAIKRINMKMPVTNADDIDAVTSATCSSYSVRAACRASLLKALENYNNGQN